MRSDSLLVVSFATAFLAFGAGCGGNGAGQNNAGGAGGAGLGGATGGAAGGVVGTGGWSTAGTPGTRADGAVGGTGGPGGVGTGGWRPVSGGAGGAALGGAGLGGGGGTAGAATGGRTAAGGVVGTGGSAGGGRGGTGGAGKGGDAGVVDASQGGDAAKDGPRPDGGGGRDGGAGEAGGAGGTFYIFGYVEDWSLENVDAIQYDKVTHLSFGFALPKSDGTLEPLDATAKTRLDALVTRAHAKGIPVLLSFGGWHNGDDSAFHALTKTASKRATFIDAAIALVDQHRLDGVDIDWEFPEPGTEDAYTALMAELSARLRPAGRMLTAAVNFDGYTAGGVTAAAYEFIDLLLVMCYGYPFQEYQSGLQYWLDKGFPRERLVLGVTFYSQNYVAYGSIVAKNPEAAQLNEFGGETYNGIPMIQRKTQLAMEKASGIMIWELAGDSSDPALSLLSAIYAQAHP